ncbi:S-adenosyl-L-methionine-dependent methyltransferase [Pseudomassariella vexata]|uniref:S-adenosyl-L-methionine-dependent methyltransferase n=1 Tax=Pseudomassariella vexata TaxID=1141098 RepID=A0A1Y2D6Q0_9PEZI|nr:S-adenosyl-L-methionine-dependent methyltransferase [Pseudomassariella vexata]ORY54971.1 S-adenosyl-L-methionine-dependent methyltransferase [Pseudomassariella vexata]
MPSTERSIDNIRKYESEPKLTLTPVEETLLSMLYFRVLDASSAEPILGDIYAQQVVNQVNTDFSRSLFPNDARWVKLWCTRAKQLDTWCREFLALQPECTVLHLGCGMDSRVLRMAPGPGVRWFDVDRPAVIALRQRLIPTPSGDYHMIPADVTDEEWLHEVPNDRPTMVVMEGLVMYLTLDKGKRMIQRLVDRFSPSSSAEGGGGDGGKGRMAFDIMGTLAARMLDWDQVPVLRKTGVRWRWPTDDPTAFEAIDSRMRFLGEATWPEDWPPWFGELTTKLLSFLPSFKNIGRAVLYEF